jgi:hypothetical protein
MLLAAVLQPAGTARGTSVRDSKDTHIQTTSKLSIQCISELSLSLVIMPTELNNQRNAAILHFNCMGLDERPRSIRIWIKIEKGIGQLETST